MSHTVDYHYDNFIMLLYQDFTVTTSKQVTKKNLHFVHIG